MCFQSILRSFLIIYLLLQWHPLLCKSSVTFLAPTTIDRRIQLVPLQGLFPLNAAGKKRDPGEEDGRPADVTNIPFLTNKGNFLTWFDQTPMSRHRQ